MGEKENEFYKKLLNLVDNDMEILNINPNQYNDVNYFISRQTYYNIKAIAERKGDKKRLKHPTLVRICDHFGYDLTDVEYILKRKKQ